MLRAIVLSLMLCSLVRGVAPPATSASTRPADMEPLLDGSLRYLPPPGWKLVGKSNDNRSASYVSEDDHGRIDINVTPQDRELPESAAQQMAMIIGKGLRDSAKQAGRELLLPPRVEKDEGFFLIVHDRMSGESGGVVDRRQLYRVVGLNLVHVAVSAFTEQEGQADQVHSVGKELLAGMRLTRGAAPVVFGKTQIKITTPIDWKLAKSDQPNGLVATYTDPKDRQRQIIVRARVLPKDARTDTAKRDAILARMIDDDRRQPPLKPSDEGEQDAGDGTSLRRLRTTAERGEQKLVVDTRYLAVADVLLSVRSVAADGDNEIAKLADALVASVKPVHE